MIETLCIAAEITAAALLLSVLLPCRRKTSHAEQGTSHLDSSLLIRSERAVQALQLLSLNAISRRGRDVLGSESEESQEFVRQLGEMFSCIDPIIPSTPVDDLTSLRDRRGLEFLFSVARPWKSIFTRPIRVALFQADSLEQVEEAHGLVAPEIALRHASRFLVDRVGGLGVLVRYNHSCFALAMVDWGLEDAKQWTESIRRKLSSETVPVGEAEAHVTYSAALIEVDLACEPSDLWELAEDGIAKTVAQGGNAGMWFDHVQTIWRSMEEQAAEQPTNADHSESKSSFEDAEPTVQPIAKAPVEVASNPPETEPVAPSTVHASKEESVAPPKEKTVSSPTKADAVTSDDIASLFQAAQHQKSVPKAAAAPNGDSNQSVKATPVAEQASDDLNAAATSDDIAALFASVKGAVSSIPEDSSNLKKSAPLESAKSLDVPALKPEAEIDAPATEDDIAALFAAFKS